MSKQKLMLRSELAPNVAEDGSTTTVTNSRNYDVDRQPADANSNASQKTRRSRYLRQTYRPRRRPPFDMRMRNAKRPMYPMYPPPRNHFKPPRSYPPPKSRYRYQESWRHKWPEQNQPYGPYSAIDEEEEEAEHYDDEYDEMEDTKNEEPWLSKKYRDSGYDDVIPLASKYSEKRSPTRYLPNSDMVRGRARPTYDLFESLRKDSQAAAWMERNRLSKNYRQLLELLGSKKLLESYYEDSFPASRLENHRFKLANLARYKNSDDDFDFGPTIVGVGGSGSSGGSSSGGGNGGFKLKRYKSDQVLPQINDEKSSDENRFEQQVQNVAKYVAAHHSTFPAKLELPHEVVYSAKYRGMNKVESKDGAAGDRKQDTDKSKVDAHPTATGSAEDATEWKRDQHQPVYQAYLSDKINFEKNEPNIIRSQTYKPDHLLPSDLIAYMSANPAEQVVGKEERYLEPTYPYDILKAVFPGRKISPVIDHDLEITFDERLSDWKH